MEVKEMYELVEHIQSKNWAALQITMESIHEADIAEVLGEIDIKEALIVYRLLPKEKAANVFSFLDTDRQSELTSLVNDEELKGIIQELYFDDKIDLLEEMPANLVKKILRNTSSKERRLINQFLNYQDETAGSLMTIEFMDLKKEMTITQAMDRIRRLGLRSETVYTLYVIDEARKLEGTLSLKNLVLAETDEKIGQVMKEDVISVPTHADQEEVAELFKKYDLLSLPVVDGESRLVGIITIDDIVDVIEEETTEDFERMAAIEPTDDEYLDLGPVILAKKRIIWLVVLMFSATITELITNHNQALLSSYTILMGVIPMLMSAGGNAGAQSSTLVIRALTLGDVEFKNILSVLWKEMRVGLLIGVSLGSLNFLRIWLINGEWYLAMIVGITLIGTATMAAIMGGLLPIIAKKLKMDPAVMANPLITTITDATTLLIYFTIASIVLYTL